MVAAAQEDEVRLIAMEAASTKRINVFHCRKCDAEFLSAEACEQHKMRRHASEIASEREVMMDSIINSVIRGDNEVEQNEEPVAIEISDEQSTELEAVKVPNKVGRQRKGRRRSVSLACQTADTAVPVRIPTKPRPVYAPPARTPISVPNRTLIAKPTETLVTLPIKTPIVIPVKKSITKTNLTANTIPIIPATRTCSVRKMTSAAVSPVVQKPATESDEEQSFHLN